MCNLDVVLPLLAFLVIAAQVMSFYGGLRSFDGTIDWIQHVVAIGAPTLVAGVLVGAILAIMRFVLQLELSALPMRLALVAAAGWGMLWFQASVEQTGNYSNVQSARNMPTYNNLYLAQSARMGQLANSISSWRQLQMLALLLPIVASGLLYGIFRLATRLGLFASVTLGDAILWAFAIGVLIVDQLLIIWQRGLARRYN